VVQENDEADDNLEHHDHHKNHKFLRNTNETLNQVKKELIMRGNYHQIDFKC